MRSSRPDFAIGPSAALQDSFENLLAGEPGRPVDLDELVKLAFERGRVLLQAPAGAGKSSLLVGLIARVEEKTAKQLVNLRSVAVGDSSWSTSDDAEQWLWSQLRRNPGECLLCLDSLDEIPGEQGQNLLEAVERVTVQKPDLAVVVADRLGRRQLRTDRWALLSLSDPRPADRAAVDSESTPSWPRLPFFADIREVYGSFRTPAGAVERRLEKILSSDEQRTVAAVAFEAWARPDRSVMNRVWLEGSLGSPLVEKMIDTGLLLRAESDTVVFGHNLVHGYFAALALSSDEKLWDKPRFETLTSRNADYEALGMLLNMVNDSRVDLLVRRVNAWNFYAAAYLLAEDYDAGNRTSPWLSAALLFLLGRRKFSPVPSTRLQVEDSLRRHRGNLAATVLGTSDEEALVSLAVRQTISNEWWEQWLSVFSRPAGDTVTAEDIEVLVHEDDVIAWTAANVFLDCAKDAETRARLADIADTGSDDGARWRAVHVLGSTDDPKTLGHLIRILRSDPSAWVRNGALRSAILVASKLERAEARTEFFAELADISGELLNNPRSLREIERSTQLEAPPPGWADAVGSLLEELWAHAESVDQQDRWRRLSAALRTQWAGSSKLGTL